MSIRRRIERLENERRPELRLIVINPGESVSDACERTGETVHSAVFVHTGIGRAPSESSGQMQGS